MPRGARAAGAAALALLLGGCASAPAGRDAAPEFFDDFTYADVAALSTGGWTVREAAGHPGVPGAAWGPQALSLVADDDPAGARRGNRLLRLSARTDGTPQGTRQAQLCHQRKMLYGTYAARLRFSDAPSSGERGDPVVQSFYAVGDLRFAFDPQFSEVDWEYLPDGGWGSPRTRLYGISWQTVRIDPWLAFNAPHETFGPQGGWHQLTMQVAPDGVRMFLDDRLVATPAGRDVPVTPMAIAFNEWFSPAGVLPASHGVREWHEDVDWVWHAEGEALDPAAVAARVATLRARGVARRDTVPATTPALPARCDM